MAWCTSGIAGETPGSGPARGFRSRSSRSTGTTWSAFPQPAGSPRPRPAARAVADGAARFIATCGGLGYAPISGTVASLPVALVVWLAAPRATDLAVAVGLVTAIGIWAAGREEARVGVRDPSSIVVYEVAGMLIALIGQPPGFAWALTLFFLFRVMDVWKPFPIRQLQDLPGGWGVVTDDLLAGVYANLVGRAIGWIGGSLL